MVYRDIGNTGMRASIIGLGAEHLDGKPYEAAAETIGAALDSGINIIDVFMPGEEIRKNIGRALGSRRGDVILQGHIGSVDTHQQYDISRDLPTCKRYFEDLLKHLGTDYIDVGMMFYIDSQDAFDKMFEGEILHYVQELKKQGTIRAIGASSHNPVYAKKVAETGIVDLIMFSINPAFDMTPAEVKVLDTLSDEFAAQRYVKMDPVRQDFYSTCEQRGVAITVMKTLGAGKLLSAEHSPFAQPMSVVQCIHYALSRPAVVSTLVGCQSREQITEAVSYLTASEAERDFTAVLEGYAGGFEGHCMYCNHCLPCPSGIDIAALTKFLDVARLDPQNIPPSIVQHYNSLEAHGGDCIACGSCMERCPFGVDVISNMAAAQSIFGK